MCSLYLFFHFPLTTVTFIVTNIGLTFTVTVNDPSEMDDTGTLKNQRQQIGHSLTKQLTNLFTYAWNFGFFIFTGLAYQHIGVMGIQFSKW